MKNSKDKIDCESEKRVPYHSLQKRKCFWTNHQYRQLFLLISLVANMFSAGVDFGTTTVLIPQLREEGELNLTKEMESWLYSVQSIATLPSIFSLPLIIERYGRRWVFCACAAINTLGWILEYFANTFSMYLTAEILHGVSLGSNLIVGVIYISEASDPKYRGIFLVFKTASFVWGIWMANIIGTFSDSKYACILGGISSFFTCIGMIFLAESPIWLAGKGRYQSCKKSFLWFRGKSENSDKELKQLIAQYFVDDDTASLRRNQTLRDRFFVLCGQIRLKEYYLPFLLSIVCFAVYQLCGKMTISVYALVILKEITQDVSLSYKVMLIIDAISVLGMYSGCYLVFKLRRRTMLFSSTLLAALCMFVMSILLFLSENEYLSVSPMTMLILLVLYSFVVSLGPMTLPTSLFSEIVPHKYKTSLSGSASACIALFGLQFFLLKCNPYLIDTIGLKGVFLLYATMSTICILFLYFFLPETKDKTLAEIESYFTSKKHNYKSDVTSEAMTIIQSQSLHSVIKRDRM